MAAKKRRAKKRAALVRSAPETRIEGDAAYVRLPFTPKQVEIARRVVELLPDLERELAQLLGRRS